MFPRTHLLVPPLLRWSQPQIDQTLPVTSVISISVWYYRLLMLFWALWLAAALLRWLKWGWHQFAAGTLWQRKPQVVKAVPAGEKVRAIPCISRWALALGFVTATSVVFMSRTCS